MSTERNLSDATEDACGQLTRYGGIFNEELLQVVEKLTDINDDLHHGRSADGIIKDIDAAKALLDMLRAQVASGSELGVAKLLREIASSLERGDVRLLPAQNWVEITMGPGQVPERFTVDLRFANATRAAT